MKFMNVLILSTLITFNANAFEFGGKLVGLTLEDGSNLNIDRDVKKVFLGSNALIDQVELKNGEIFYDFEIKKATFDLGRGHRVDLPLDINSIKGKLIHVLRAVGGDGSGGG